MDHYPSPLPVPAGLRSARLELRMLRAEDVDRDLEAVEASREALLRRSGGRWPRPGFGWRDNLADLVVHQIEHLRRQAFTYTVMAPGGGLCLGCLYLRPLAEQLERLVGAPPEVVAAADARASGATFWLRPDAQAVGLDRQLLRLLRPWFREAWGFSEVMLLANDAEGRNRQLFETAGLSRSHQLSGAQGRRWWLSRA
jgi:hypothetical protein